jgi:hypothetical protein
MHPHIKPSPRLSPSKRRGGTGGSPPDEQYPPLILPPMPVISEMRKLLEQSELVLDLYDIVRDQETRPRLDAWIERMVRHKPIFVSVPKLLIPEAQVVKAIFEYEVKVIKQVKTRLRHDINQLTPFDSDGEMTKQRKRNVIRQHEHDLNTLTTKANQEAQSGKNWKNVEETSTHQKLRYESDIRACCGGTRKESSALQQLSTIAVDGKWKGQ